MRDFILVIRTGVIARLYYYYYYIHTFGAPGYGEGPVHGQDHSLMTSPKRVGSGHMDRNPEFQKFRIRGTSHFSYQYSWV